MKRTKFVLAYAVASVLLASLLVVSAVNYLNYFPALESVTISVASQSLVRNSANNVTEILTAFQVANPSSYSGFRIQWATLSLYFSSGSDTLFLKSQRSTSLTLSGTGSTLGPGKTVTMNVTFGFLPQDSSSLTAFLNDHANTVISQYTISIRLVTFLQALQPIDIEKEIRKPLI